MRNGNYIKVCGMTEGKNIRAVEALGADFIGMIFYPASPRKVVGIPDYLPETAARVGVFVNASEAEILEKVVAYGLDLVQLHGDESPEFCSRLDGRGVGVIKAFSVSSESDLARTSAYEGLCRYYLFDTPTAGRGGSGKRFDWSLLQAYSGETPFLLSGGIGPESAAALSEFSHPMLAGYDLNSRFESEPGVKDVALLGQFLYKI